MSFFEKQALIIAAQKLETEERALTLALSGVPSEKLPEWEAPRFVGDTERETDEAQYRQRIAAWHAEWEHNNVREH